LPFFRAREELKKRVELRIRWRRVDGFTVGRGCELNVNAKLAEGLGFVVLRAVALNDLWA
jgi:hypothetical protein